jgi:hypothetical protein
MVRYLVASSKPGLNIGPSLEGNPNFLQISATAEKALCLDVNIMDGLGTSCSADMSRVLAERAYDWALRKKILTDAL